MRPSELYAKTCNLKCEGSEKCHWCGAACGQFNLHDDVPFLPFVKSTQSPRYPFEKWICNGCYSWRRKSLTVNFLDGSFKDRQCPMTHSWLLTDIETIGLEKGMGKGMYPILLAPPLRFSLSLVTNGKTLNFIHLCMANDLPEIKANTELAFTLDNIPLAYTVYELEGGLRYGSEGKMPGVRALIDFFGKGDLEPIPEVKKDKGRQHTIMTERRNAEERAKMLRQVR